MSALLDLDPRVLVLFRTTLEVERRLVVDDDEEMRILDAMEEIDEVLESLLDDDDEPMTLLCNGPGGLWATTIAPSEVYTCEAGVV